MDEKNETLRDTIVPIGYACAGTCLAIILSVDDQYRAAHPWTMRFLAAGFPMAVIAAAAWEKNFPVRDRSIFPMSALTGVVIALIGIACYFLGSDTTGTQQGFCMGIGGAAAIFLTKAAKRHEPITGK